MCIYLQHMKHVHYCCVVQSGTQTDTHTTDDDCYRLNFANQNNHSPFKAMVINTKMVASVTRFTNHYVIFHYFILLKWEKDGVSTVICTSSLMHTKEEICRRSINSNIKLIPLYLPVFFETGKGCDRCSKTWQTEIEFHSDCSIRSGQENFVDVQLDH